MVCWFVAGAFHAGLAGGLVSRPQEAHQDHGAQTDPPGRPRVQGRGHVAQALLRHRDRELQIANEPKRVAWPVQAVVEDAACKIDAAATSRAVFEHAVPSRTIYTQWARSVALRGQTTRFDVERMASDKPGHSSEVTTSPISVEVFASSASGWLTSRLVCTVSILACYK